jgi:hypothetical protein
MSAIAENRTNGSLRGGVLGLAWGARMSSVQAAYPNARVVPHTTRVGIAAQGGLLGIRSRMHDLFLLTVESERGLTGVSFQIDGPDVPQMLKALRDELGPGRSLEQKSLFGTFSQVHEWSTPEVSARVQYSTRESGATAPVAGDVGVEVRAGAMESSLIDTMLAPMDKRAGQS